MRTVTLTPYILFDGNCREALDFYQDAFGGMIHAQSYGDTDPGASEEMKHRVMHATLTGGRVEIMAGDAPEVGGYGRGKVSLALSGTDEQALSDMFAKLSAGVEAETPLERQMWGDIYGAVIDRFGIHWMVNITSG